MFKIVLIFPPTKNGGKFAAVEKTGNIPENFSPGYGAFYDNIGQFWEQKMLLFCCCIWSKRPVFCSVGVHYIYICIYVHIVIDIDIDIDR